MAIYLRGKYLRYRFRFAGKQIDESTKTTSKTIAREAERQHRRALEAGYNNFKELRENRVRVLQEIIDEYLVGYRLRYLSATFAEYALGHVARLLETKVVGDITDSSVLHYQEDRLREKAAPKPCNVFRKSILSGFHTNPPHSEGHADQAQYETDPLFDNSNRRGLSAFLFASPFLPHTLSDTQCTLVAEVAYIFMKTARAAIVALNRGYDAGGQYSAYACVSHHSFLHKLRAIYIQYDFRYSMYIK
jgi:hypothetical protein